MKNRVSEQIKTLDDIQTQGNLQLGSSFPTFNGYLVNDSQTKLLSNHYSYGKELNSYILWGAVNNQFCNATLTEITYTSILRKKVALAKDTAKKTFEGLLTEDVVAEAAELDLPAAVEFIIKSLDTVSNEDGENAGTVEKIQFTINNKQLNAVDIKSSPQYVQSLIDAYATAVSKGKITSVSKEDYILACATLAGSLDSTDIDSERVLQYHKLDQLRNDFLSFIAKQSVQNTKAEALIHRDASSQLLDKFITDCEPVIAVLNSIDGLLRDRVFQFVPSLPSVPDMNKKKEAIYKEFEKCFTNVTGKKKMHNKVKDEHYFIDGKIERDLPANIFEVNLL